MTGCDGAGTAERSYPVSGVSGCREELPRIQGQEWRPGGHTATEIMGGDPEELPRARGQGRRLGGATSHPRPGAVTLRSHPEPEARDGSWKEPPVPEARACRREEQPEEQPKEQWLRRCRRA